MLLQQGNIWDEIGNSHALVITTNPSINQNGFAVMGRGVAKEANLRYFPQFKLAKHFASLLKEHGNHVLELVKEDGTMLVSFPVKHHWADNAKPELIERSCQELVALTNANKWEHVVMVFPGIGNGHLPRATVEPILEKYLDDRFTVYTK